MGTGEDEGVIKIQPRVYKSGVMDRGADTRTGSSVQ